MSLYSEILGWCGNILSGFNKPLLSQDPTTVLDFVPQSCIKINNKIKSWGSMQLIQSYYNEQLFQYFCKRCNLFFYFRFFWWGLQGRQAEKVSPDKLNHGPTPPGASSDICKPTVRNNLSWSLSAASFLIQLDVPDSALVGHDQVENYFTHFLGI